jgi:hypothetical protein
MSGAYSLYHIFDELLDEKASVNSTARGKTMGAKSQIYQDSWTALNAWIETKLAKQKVISRQIRLFVSIIIIICLICECRAPEYLVLDVFVGS